MFKSWFGKDPKKALREAVDGLDRCVAEGAPKKTTQKALQRLEEASASAEESALVEALSKLATIATKAPLVASSSAIHGLAILLEKEIDPRPASEVVLTRSAEAFERAARHVTQLDTACDEAEARLGRPLTEADGQAIMASLKVDPEDVAVGNVIDSFALALLALLPRSKASRKKLRDNAAFCEALLVFARFEDRPSGKAALFARLLDDEEILVIHPATGRGAKVTISGITHNFQLHTLLADALIPGLVKGKRPDPIVVAEARDRRVPKDELPVTEASFHLMDYGAVREDGSIEDDPFEHVIWHEGVPADIPVLDGARIVILGEPTRKHTWRAPRDFPAMVGELSITERLSPEDVAAWLKRMSAAPRPPRSPRRPPPSSS